MSQRESKKRKSSAKKPEPSVLSINICDAIIRDERTKKVSLIGLFGVINSQSFPAVHPQMHLYVAMTNGHGKYQIDIRFVNATDNKILVGMKGDINFPSPLQVVELNLEWRNIKFDKPGDYIVEVLCNNNLSGSRKFKVLGPQNVLPPTSETKG